MHLVSTIIIADRRFQAMRYIVRERSEIQQGLPTTWAREGATTWLVFARRATQLLYSNVHQEECEQSHLRRTARALDNTVKHAIDLGSKGPTTCWRVEPDRSRKELCDGSTNMESQTATRKDGAPDKNIEREDVSA